MFTQSNPTLCYHPRVVRAVHIQCSVYTAAHLFDLLAEYLTISRWSVLWLIVTHSHQRRRLRGHCLSVKDLFRFWVHFCTLDVCSKSPNVNEYCKEISSSFELNDNFVVISLLCGSPCGRIIIVPCLFHAVSVLESESCRKLNFY